MSARPTIPDSRWLRLLRPMQRWSRDWLIASRDFVFPPSCACCRAEMPSAAGSPLICETCLAGLVPASGPECQKCAAPVGPYLNSLERCIHCRSDRFRFERVIRLGVYREQLGQAVRRAKSEMGDGLARMLTDLLWQRQSDELQALNCDVIVPIPHFWTRRFSIRPAASESIAQRLAELLKHPCQRGLLRKTRWTPSQAGSPPSIRRKQQKNAFAASNKVRGQKVLLVDDVLTTGATADEAAKSLLASGAASVVVAVIARGLGEHA